MVTTLSRTGNTCRRLEYTFRAAAAAAVGLLSISAGVPGAVPASVYKPFRAKATVFSCGKRRQPRIQQQQQQQQQGQKWTQQLLP